MNVRELIAAVSDGTLLEEALTEVHDDAVPVTRLDMPKFHQIASSPDMRSVINSLHALQSARPSPAQVIAAFAKFPVNAGHLRDFSDMLRSLVSNL